MKGKNLQPRINTPPSKTLFRFDGEIKSFPDKQVKRIQHHQINFTTNAKGNSLGRKQEKEKKKKTNSELLR